MSNYCFKGSPQGWRKLRGSIDVQPTCTGGVRILARNRLSSVSTLVIIDRSVIGRSSCAPDRASKRLTRGPWTCWMLLRWSSSLSSWTRATRCSKGLNELLFNPTHWVHCCFLSSSLLTARSMRPNTQSSSDCKMEACSIEINHKAGSVGFLLSPEKPINLK